MFTACYICEDLYCSTRRQCPSCGAYVKIVNNKVADVIWNETLVKVLPIAEAHKGVIRANGLVDKQKSARSFGVLTYSEWVNKAKSNPAARLLDLLERSSKPPGEPAINSIVEIDNSLTKVKTGDCNGIQWTTNE